MATCKFTVVFFVLLVSSKAFAGDYFRDWETKDTALLSAALATTAVDWGQTLYVAKHPEKYERNPFLSRHPSVAEVNRYFGFVMLGTIGLSAVLPVTQRRWALGGLLVVETVVIVSNNHVGIKMAF